MYKHFKRLLDFTFSVVLLIILSPVFLAVSFAILVTMGRPILFTQKRAGRHNEIFEVKKFRTMSNSPGNDAQRVTPLGRTLRKFSIDEFPQLINIFKGEMSFIGPRPLLPEYLPYYNDREKIRHQVRPGMTSLGGVRGRSYLTWEDQFEMDAIYVENLSFKQDMSIFLKTIPKVLGSKDMMVTGRIDQDRFDIHRQKQLDLNRIKNERS